MSNDFQAPSGSGVNNSLFVPTMTTAQRVAVILRTNEWVLDSTDHNLYRGDGATLGGVLQGANGAGRTYFVNSATGADTNNGLSWSGAFKTLTAANAVAVDYDTIMLLGTFTEALTVTKKLAFIGASNTVNDAVWMESAAGQTLATVTATNCLFYNIRFRIPTTGGIGLDLTASDYTKVLSCAFQGRGGSYYGIRINGGSQLKINANVFTYLNTATYGCAILGNSTTNVPTGLEIAGNTFHSNLRHVKASMRQSFIHNNLFQEKGLDADNASVLTATTKLDVTGETSGSQLNTVTRNMFQGTYSISGGYKASASADNWFGNASDKVSATGVTADGVTTAVPA